MVAPTVAGLVGTGVAGSREIVEAQFAETGVKRLSIPRVLMDAAREAITLEAGGLLNFERALA